MCINIYHLLINSSNEEENLPAGNFGASSFTTCFNCSNGVPHVSYGNLPVANSTREIPNDQTSDLMSYCDGLPDGSILSGCKRDNNRECIDKMRDRIYNTTLLLRTAIYGLQPASIVFATESTR